MLLATMDISARAISLTDRPRPGHLGHQYSHAPGRPNLHFVSSSSQTSAGTSYRSDYAIAGSSSFGLISRWTIKQLGQLR
jgi:hypothetical protein